MTSLRAGIALPRTLSRPPSSAMPRRGTGWWAVHVAVLRSLRPPLLGLALVVIAGAANALTQTLPWAASLLLGLVCFLVLPTALVRAKIDWPVRATGEQWVLALSFTILGYLLLGLAMNYLLPMSGLDAPLTRVPVVVVGTAAVLGLLVWRPTRALDLAGALRSMRPGANTRGSWGLALVVVLGLTLTVMGAVRLNNGLGGNAALVALTVWCVVLLVLLRRAGRWSAARLSLGLYGLSLALLLMTSLRGWQLSGHDIQYEYKVFALTAQAGRWEPELYSSPYYACLSITILPTQLMHLLAIDPLLLFKVVYPLVFAVVPVGVFWLARRLASARLAVIAAALFVIFPTYFSDMPFLARQEIAFLFLVASLCLLGLRGLSWPRLLALQLALGLGVMLSHYSTNYFFIAVVGLAVAGTPVLRVIMWLRSGRPARRGPAPVWRRRPTFGLVWLAALTMLTVAWTGPVTHSAGQVEATLDSLQGSLFGGAQSVRSADTRYSVFGSDQETAEEKFARYQQLQLTKRAALAGQDYLYPMSTVDRYPADLAPNQTAAFTEVGRRLHDVGLDPSMINGLLRSGIAIMFQLLLVIGVAASLWRRSLLRRVDPDLRAMSAASLVLITLTVLLPSLSVNYGVLRAFQQGLLVFAPIVAIGLATAVRPLKRRTSAGAVVVVMACALSLTGIVPQLLGGYPRQLHLNNAGQYYDIYVTHDQEAAAMEWFNEPYGETNARLVSDKYTASRLQIFTANRPNFNLYPVELPKDDFVILGTTTVQQGHATVFFDGDLFTYDYPTAILDDHRSLVYASDGARIYR